MKSIFLSLLWLVVTLVVVGVASWHLAFQRGSNPPEAISVSILEEGQIFWIDGGDADINLASPEDVESALGVAHALGRPWLMALYRQAALGRLSEWFGTETLGLDKHVREMGIPPSGSGALPGTSREALERYRDGVRAGQLSGDWSLMPAAVELGVEPEPWEIEHTLAIERLFAWLSSSFPGSGETPASLALKTRRDSLAAFLGLSGMEQSAAWATQRHGLYARLISGDSGLPPVLTVSLSSRNRLVYEGATIAGLPFRLCGRSQTASWCKLFSGRVDVSIDTSQVTSTYQSIELRDGTSRAVRRTTAGNALRLDSTAVRWSGMSHATDASAWMALPNPEPFELTGAEGLLLTATGVRNFGVAPAASGSVVYVGGGREMELLAARIDAIDDSLGRGVSLLHDTGSALTDSLSNRPGPEDLSGDSLLVVSPSESALTPRDPAAVSYIRNWDGRFEGSSIGATLYDAERSIGPAAVDSLTAWFGSDPGLWRWELNPDLTLQYPAAHQAELPSRYQRVAWLRTGHPTAPAWGPSSIWLSGGADGPLPTAWEAYLGRPGGAAPMEYRRPHVPFDTFLGRFRVAPVRPQLGTLQTRATRFVTDLQPQG